MISQQIKNKWKKIIIAIGVIIVLIIVLLSLPSFLNLFVSDIAPIDDSDLSLKVVTISDSDNAYFDLAKLEKTIYEPEGKSQIILDMFAGKTWNDKIAEEIISRNSQAFGYFAEAAHRSKFQDPALANPANITPNIVAPPMNSWRRMARLSAIRAMYLAKQGKDKEAMVEVLNSVNIGQKIQESQTSLSEYIIAITMKEIGLEAAQKVIVTSKLATSDLKQYSQDLNQYYKNEDGLISSFKTEYRIHTLTIDAIVSGDKKVLQSVVDTEKFKNNYYFQPNKTKLLFAEYARANIKNVNRPCGEIKSGEISKLAPTNPAKLYIEENAIGEILYDLVASSLPNMSTKKCVENSLVEVTQSLMGIKAYKNDTKNYPKIFSR